MDETCRLRRGEGYGVCIDEAAKQDKAAGSCAPRGGHICPPCGPFQGFARTFQKQRKTALGRCSTKKSPPFQGKRRGSTEIVRRDSALLRDAGLGRVWAAGQHLLHLTPTQEHC